jgi:hypothetical protein
MSTLLDTFINQGLEATRVLFLNGLRLEAIGISTSAYINGIMALGVGVIKDFVYY